MKMRLIKNNMIAFLLIVSLPLFSGTKKVDNPVQNGVAVQIRNDYGKTSLDKDFCGSIYDIKKVSEDRVKKTSKWDRINNNIPGANHHPQCILLKKVKKEFP